MLSIFSDMFRTASMTDARCKHDLPKQPKRRWEEERDIAIAKLETRK